VLKVLRETGVNTDPQGRAISELNEVLEGINETLDQVDERGAIKRLKDIRYEFNPKYFDYSLAAESIFRKVMTCVSLETLSLSSIHIALDYSVDINSLQITDVKSRKENIFRGTNKRVETIYFGKRASRNHIIIYDKKLENENNDSIDQYPDEKNVTRFEARLKNNYARDFLTGEFNPFEGIIISDDFEGSVLADDSLTDSQAGKILLYFRHPDRLHRTSSATKKRFQAMMKSYAGLHLNVAGDYIEQKNSLVGELESWFKPLSKQQYTKIQ
ncbi:replication initiation factor domain-containing protein, partial [Terribacillus saccharophilus]